MGTTGTALVVLGIDPGITGAIAAMRGDDVGVWPMPVIERKTGMRRNKKGERVPKISTSIDAERLARLIGDVVNVGCPQTESVAFIEGARASPTMGVVSAFHYGEGFGIVRGILAHLGVPERKVTADKWKRDMGLITKGSREFGRNEARDKHRSLDLARKLYPKLHDLLNLVKNEGLAEALLICHWGCEQIEAEEAQP